MTDKDPMQFAIEASMAAQKEAACVMDKLLTHVFEEKGYDLADAPRLVSVVVHPSGDKLGDEVREWKIEDKMLCTETVQPSLLASNDSLKIAVTPEYYGVASEAASDFPRVEIAQLGPVAVPEASDDD